MQALSLVCDFGAYQLDRTFTKHLKWVDAAPQPLLWLEGLLLTLVHTELGCDTA